MRFRIKPEIFFGDNAIGYLREMDLGRVLIISDPFIIESGTINLVTDELNKMNVEYTIFSDVVPNVPVKNVAAGLEVMFNFEPNSIIAVGGGSAIDTGKAIKHISSTRNEKFKLTELIAIPTTSGTGSEATSHAVILDEEADIKNSLSHEDMIPEKAILDVNFVKTVPSEIAADTGLDVLVHAMEAYVSTDSNELTDLIALKAIKDVFEYLPKVVEEDCMDARYQMHIASALAGMAFENAGLGITHSMAHILGAKFLIPHGKINGILLPYVMRYNGANGDRSKYLKLADELGVPGFSPDLKYKNLVTKVEDLKERLGVIHCLADGGYEDYTNNHALVSEMAEIALNDQCTPTNPAKVTKEDFEKLLVEAYVGYKNRY